MDTGVSKRTGKSAYVFGNGNQILVGYVDVDMAGDVDSRKSASGYLITLVGGSCLMKITTTKVCCFKCHRSIIHNNN